MQFDGLTMRACLDDVRANAAGGRLQRISQLTPLSLSLEFWAGRQFEIIVSAEPDAACVVLSRGARLVAEPPSVFCTSLRRTLQGKRLEAVTQQGWDRVARLTFAGRDELGDATEVSLIIETMGKHSNLICTKDDGRIVDTAKRIGRSRSRVRQVLPGLMYEPPPGQDKMAPDQVIPERFAQVLMGLSPELPNQTTLTPLTKLLLGQIQGLGPARAKAIAAAALAESPGDQPALAAKLSRRLQDLAGRTAADAALEAATVDAAFRDWLLRKEDPAGHAGSPTASKSGDEQSLIRAAVQSGLEHSERRLRAAQEQLSKAGDPEQYRQQADAVLSSLAQVRTALAQAREAGLTDLELTLPRYDAEDAGDDGVPIAREQPVQLETDCDPAQAAQRLYAQYADTKRSRGVLKRLLAKEHLLAQHLTTLDFQLSQELQPRELAEIRAEVIGAGIKLVTPKRKTGRPESKDTSSSGGVRRFMSPGGLPVLVGRNNQQNEALLRQGTAEDVWFHARGVAGAHVLLRTGGTVASPADLEYAAAVAAHHSQARSASRVAVDMCPLARIRKPRGAPPGFVTYTGERTLFVQPLPEPEI